MTVVTDILTPFLELKKILRQKSKLSANNRVETLLFTGSFL